MAPYFLLGKFKSRIFFVKFSAPNFFWESQFWFFNFRHKWPQNILRGNFRSQNKLFLSRIFGPVLKEQSLPQVALMLLTVEERIGQTWMLNFFQRLIEKGQIWIFNFLKFPKILPVKLRLVFIRQVFFSFFGKYFFYFSASIKLHLQEV